MDNIEALWRDFMRLKVPSARHESRTRKRKKKRLLSMAECTQSLLVLEAKQGPLVLGQEEKQLLLLLIEV